MGPKSRMVTLDSELFKCCHKLETLGWSNDAEAKKLLQKAANQVKPIMAKRRWAVPVLAEFYPPMPNLLGLNHNRGQKIEVRLRRPSDRDTFLPYESILGTLLHELAHIQVGPHNKQFYDLLDELNKECDQLISAGNDGASEQNFSGGGNRLGDWSVTTVPRHQAAQTAAAAAMKRHRKQAIMSHGPQRLGGRTAVARISDPRIMALQAAERRRADDVWCASGRDASATHASPIDEGQGQRPNAPSGNEVIVIQDSDEEKTLLDNQDNVEVIDVDNVDVICLDEPVKPIIPAASLPVRRNPAAQAALRRFGQG